MPCSDTYDSLLLCLEDAEQAYVSMHRRCTRSTSPLHGLLLLLKCTYACTEHL